MKKRYLILLAALYGLVACGEHPCSKAVLHFRLIGFSDAEADTMVLRRFNKNASLPLDSFEFNANNPVRFSRFGDTLVPVQFPPAILMQSDFDYELDIPGASRSYRITEIREEQKYVEKGLFGTVTEDCGNELTSVQVNGQPMPIQFPYTLNLRK